MIRPKVYNRDRLVKGWGRRTKAGSKGADEEYERRNGIREVYQRLSRYYKLEDGQTAWSAPRLLSRGEHDFYHPTSRRFTYLISFSIGRSRDWRGSSVTRCCSLVDNGRFGNLKIRWNVQDHTYSPHHRTLLNTNNRSSVSVL